MWVPRGSNFITIDVNMGLALSVRASHNNTYTNAQTFSLPKVIVKPFLHITGDKQLPSDQKKGFQGLQRRLTMTWHMKTQVKHFWARALIISKPSEAFTRVDQDQK